MNQNGIQSYNLISAVDFILFRKYIAAVQIINQWMNEWIKKVTISWNDKERFLTTLRTRNQLHLSLASSSLLFALPIALNSISVSCVDSCWEALKSTIWNDANRLEDSITQDFATHGHPLGLCASKCVPRANLSLYLVSRTLYPPQQTCINASCSHSRTRKLLKKEEQRQGVLYTLDKGVLQNCSFSSFVLQWYVFNS